MVSQDVRQGVSKIRNRVVARVFRELGLIEQVTEQVARLLACLEERPLGTKDAMQCLGLSHRPTYLYEYLKSAIGAGFVQMTQPASPKSPTRKYCLTKKGRRYRERGG